MKILLERGYAKDLDGLEQLYNDLTDHLSSSVNYPGWLKGIYPVRQTASDGISEGNLYVLRQEGKIAASVILRHTPEEAYNTVKWGSEDDYSKITVIYTFVVHPDYLRQGVGRKLMEMVIEQAAADGMKAIRLDVYEKNTPAMKLYQKCGFRYVDTVDLGYAEYGLDNFKLYEKII